MKIAILGSSFDPPHIGHALMAIQVKEILEMDQVWLMPCYLHPFGKKLLANKYRLEMTKYLEDESIKVSDFEIKQKKVNYTIETLNALAKIFPKNKFYWIIGSDQLASFHKWKNWQDIIQNYHLIIFPRETDFKKLENEIKKILKLKTFSKKILIPIRKDIILTNISSTQIRTRVKENKPIKYLVSKRVEEYIKKKNLYA